MLAATREKILASRATTVAQIDVPEWGGAVFVRALGALDLMRLRDAAPPEDAAGEAHLRFACQMLCCALCDANGARLFDDADAELLELLELAVLVRVAGEVRGHLGLSAEAAENLEKN
ncbi:MAG: hypothetical protein ACOY3P_03590 [Planctomycetota bacterium]